MKGILKDKLDDFEIPVSDQAWANVSSQIGGSSAGAAASGASIWGIKSLVVAALSLAAISVTTWVALRNDGATPQEQSIPPSTEQTIPSQNGPETVTALPTQAAEAVVEDLAPKADTDPAAAPKVLGKDIVQAPSNSLPARPPMKDDEMVIPTHSKEIVYREHIAELPQISALFDARMDADGNGYFKAQHSKGIQRLEWNFGDGNQSELPSPTHHYERGGLYDVTLTVTNEQGESMTSVQQIEAVVKGDLQVVNVITPNDDGQNDVFDPTALDPEATIHYLLIMNASGDKVFEMDHQAVWDGKLSDGSEAPAGTYLYFIRGLDKNKGIIEKTSKLTVSR